jgi:glutaredoxin
MRRYLLITGPGCNICKRVYKILSTKSSKDLVREVDVDTEEAIRIIVNYNIGQLPVVYDMNTSNIITGQECIKWANKLT